MIGGAPIVDVIKLVLPDESGPYRWNPEALQKPGVRLLRLLHNSIPQPRKRREVEGVQEGTWPYMLREGEILWSCYEWLAPKTHKIKIEVDRSGQALNTLVAWFRAHPEVIQGPDPLGSAQADCTDRWAQELLADDCFRASWQLLQLLLTR